MKNKNTAGILALLLWGMGIHRFYLGEGSAGIFYLLFSCTFIPAIAALFEAIHYFKMSDEEFNMKYNEWKSSDGKDHYDDLLKFNQLREKNLISEEEYQKKVKEIKERITIAEDKKKKAAQTQEEIEKNNQKIDKITYTIFKVIGIVLAIVMLLVIIWKMAGK